MLGNILSMFMEVFDSCARWFDSILSNSGMMDLFFTFIFVFFIVRFLVAPITGHSGSDKAKKRSNGTEEG